MVDKATAVSWTSKEGQVQVIGQAEVASVLVAKLTWKKSIRSMRVLYFVDNEAARLGLVKAYSAVWPSLKSIVGCMEKDAEINSKPWLPVLPCQLSGMFNMIRNRR